MAPRIDRVCAGYWQEEEENAEHRQGTVASCAIHVVGPATDDVVLGSLLNVGLR
jgi:hypothetical protein